MSGLRAVLHYPDPRPGARVRLVMLPGVGIEAADFAAHGLVAAAQAGAGAVDVIAVQPDLALYLDGEVAPVLAPVLAGAARVWLLGISLGGMGAVAYAATHPRDIEGVILLAPFLGTHGTMAELAAAGGYAGWDPAGSAATAPELHGLRWVQGHLRAGGAKLWLGHATRDRFGAGHRLLAGALPAERVALVEGGHDWPAWRAAFAALRPRLPF